MPRGLVTVVPRGRTVASDPPEEHVPIPVSSQGEGTRERRLARRRRLTGRRAPARTGTVLTAYLICLLVGGVFVGLSVAAGLGKDLGADKGFDKELGGDDLDHEAGGDGIDKELEVDAHAFDHGEADAGGDHDHALAHEAPTSDVAMAGHPGERREVPRKRWRYPARRTWVPFTSLRFWTFGACFFGLTGVALTQLAGVGEPVAALTSLGVGLASGTATAWLVKRLRAPVGAVASARGWIGAVGELTFPLEPGGLSKVRVHSPGRPPRELLAVLAPNAAMLPRGTRVVVLDFREGRAVVQPADPSMMAQELASPEVANAPRELEELEEQP